MGAGLLVTAGLLGFPSPAGAGETAVSMQQTMFTPKDVVVAAGDSVVWTNNDAAGHSATADDGSFDSNKDCGAGGACLQKGETFKATFSAPGRFLYYCRLHGGPGGGGMAGSVIVLPLGAPG